MLNVLHEGNQDMNKIATSNSNWKLHFS